MAEPAKKPEFEPRDSQNYWKPQIIEGDGEGDGQPRGKLKVVGNDDEENESKSLHEQEQGEAKGDSNLASLKEAENTPEESGLWQPGDNIPNRRDIRKMVSNAVAGNRKFGWIGGGIVGTIVGAFLLLAPALGPLHILNNLFDHNFELNDSYRRSRTTRIIRSIFNTNRTNRQLSDTPFKLKADLVDFEKFEVRMNSRGWSFEYDINGKAIGMINPAGQFVDLENLTNNQFATEMDALFKDTIPAWQMNKRVRTRNLISTFTGPRRSLKWTELFRRDKTAQPDFETAKYLKETGFDDAPTSADGSVTERRTVIDPVTGEETIVDSPSSEGTIAEEARDAVVAAKAAGATDAVAIDAGRNSIAAKIGSNPNSLIFVGLIVSCIAYQVYNQDLIGDFERYASSLRIGGTYMSAVNEIQQGGNIDIGEVGQLFKEYNSDEGSFASSAAFQRATGSTVTGPELDPDLHVIEQEGADSTVQSIFEGIGGAFAQLGIPGFGALCSFLGSAAGMIIGYIFDIAEVIVGCIVSVCAASVAKFVAIEAIFEVLGRLLAASLTSFVGFLVENPVQAGAFLDQSLSLINSEEVRTATPVTSLVYNKTMAEYKKSQNNHLSFSDRYFAIDNPKSLTFTLAGVKSNLKNINPVRVVAGLLGLPLKATLAAATSNNVYAQTDLDFDNYDFQKYTFDQSYLDSDPYDLASEVSQLMESDPLAKDFAELCMGYDADTGLVNKGLGTKMLPMFSDPQALGETEAQDRNNQYINICVEQAKDNTALYTKVGQFVNDVELITSIVELTGESVTGVSTGNSSTGGSSPLNPPLICDPNVFGDICIN